jgi:hypothetical protein
MTQKLHRPSLSVHLYFVTPYRGQKFMLSQTIKKLTRAAQSVAQLYCIVTIYTCEWNLLAVNLTQETSKVSNSPATEFEFHLWLLALTQTILIELTQSVTEFKSHCNTPLHSDCCHVLTPKYLICKARSLKHNLSSNYYYTVIIFNLQIKVNGLPYYTSQILGISIIKTKLTYLRPSYTMYLKLSHIMWL